MVRRLEGDTIKPEDFGLEIFESTGYSNDNLLKESNESVYYTAVSEAHSKIGESLTAKTILVDKQTPPQLKEEVKIGQIRDSRIEKEKKYKIQTNKNSFIYLPSNCKLDY
jgi:hypothetical protein